MPTYNFECHSCNLVFKRNLKMEAYESFVCPKCGEAAPRVFDGFGFNFAQGGSAPANSGVAKHDYPTADYAVGSDADKRWEEYSAKEVVKNKVRQVGGSHALVRTGTKDYIEYSPAGEATLTKRRRFIKYLRSME